MITQLDESAAEVIARAIGEDTLIWSAYHKSHLDRLNATRAKRVIAALHAAGYKMLPREPTKEMQRAAEDAAFGYPMAYARHYRAIWDVAPLTGDVK